MTLVPLTIFILVVIFALGGPTSFMNTLSNWAYEASTYLGRWIRSL